LVLTRLRGVAGSGGDRLQFGRGYWVVVAAEAVAIGGGIAALTTGVALLGSAALVARRV
jgi:hypothetical protein